MSDQSTSDYHYTPIGRAANSPESSFIGTSPTYQQIKAFYPQLSEDIILDLMRVNQNNARNFQLGLQQAHRSLPRHRIRKPGGRVRAQTDGSHRRSVLDARYLTYRQRESLSKRSTVTDVEEEEKVLLSTLLQSVDRNRSDKGGVTDAEGARNERVVATWDHNQNAAETSENMEIDSGTGLGFLDSTFAAATRAPPSTPELMPGIKPQRDEESFATGNLVEALLDNTACVDTEESQLHDTPMS
ncbi:hypothetical protein BU25DRAFT_414307 [Macroventuria anomochaeta]|uniref:Uncharacterized protein n=1 Tax=Macroventuria anomochaeta TaxID=301207 RepID=A0ACB6RNU2_9PLEO|nr:uncharacterized protein BU25DRAFT_414307 [Macroventuria anomochaeta]KAF2623561.1 hypothetical protein BU25DRAFT_414307 [Macroventuria anomochaeta]